MLGTRIVLALSLVSLACDEEARARRLPVGELMRHVVVLATDYQTGSLAVVDLDTKEAYPSLSPIHSDPTGRIRGEKVYVLNRLEADNIQVVDPTSGYATGLQFSVGNGANPHDLAFVSDAKMYVTLFDRKELGVFDPETGAELGTVDLSAFADTDGLPELHTLAMAGTHALVAIKGLDRDHKWALSRPGELAVIDTTTDKVVDTDLEAAGVQGIPLLGQNPNGHMVALGDGTIFVATLGRFATIDEAGIERVRSEAPYMSEWVVRESVLGGSVTSFATLDGVSFFVVVAVAQASGEGFDTVVKHYATTTGEAKEIFKTAGYQISDLALTSKGELVVCDRTLEAPGVRIFDTETGKELTQGPIDVGLPPFFVMPFDAPTDVL
jgi:hypothetical protein